MYFAVTNVTALENYKLRLKFKNGEEKIFDMAPYLETGIFKKLRDEAVFKTVKVSFDTVEWANGADIDPETLYKDGVALQPA
jgi:antitoxin component YwqK of YwqJK toxin-antitoxin module